MAIVKHRITADEFQRMGEAGVFGHEARLELIHGEIIEMPPIGSDHQSVVDRLTDLFTSRLARRVIVRVQGPVRVEPYSEPQPDVVLLERRDDYYRDAHPGPAAVRLLVEVAVSSVSYDRGVKLPLYRGHDVQEYWIVNLDDDVIEVYRTGLPGGSATYRRGQSLAPAAFPDVVLTVDEILGR